MIQENLEYSTWLLVTKAVGRKAREGSWPPGPPQVWAEAPVMSKSPNSGAWDVKMQQKREESESWLGRRQLLQAEEDDDEQQHRLLPPSMEQACSSPSSFSAAWNLSSADVDGRGAAAVAGLVCGLRDVSELGTIVDLRAEAP